MQKKPSKKAALLKLYYNGDDSEDIPTEEQELEDEKLTTKAIKLDQFSK